MDKGVYKSIELQCFVLVLQESDLQVFPTYYHLFVLLHPKALSINPHQ